MPDLALPPLTGSALFDPWRLRVRARVESGAEQTATDRRPTRSELLLWAELQRSPRGWVAEHPTRYGYSLDFFCPEVQLAVEVDGPSHRGQIKAESDAWRDSVHEQMGIRTRRFSAREVEQDAGRVARDIEAFVRTRARTLAAGPAVAAVSVPDEPARAPGWSAYLPACRTVLPAGPPAPRRPWSGWRARTGTAPTGSG